MHAPCNGTPPLLFLPPRLLARARASACERTNKVDEQQKQVCDYRAFVTAKHCSEIDEDDSAMHVYMYVRARE